MNTAPKVKFDISYATSFFQPHEFTQLERSVRLAHEELHHYTCAGNQFLGWLDLPSQDYEAELLRIEEAAMKIRNDSDVLLVIGIGGSYLGARAVIEALSPTFFNLLAKKERKAPQVFFVGHHISPTYMKDLISYLEGKDLSINVISKSGTTMEPAIAFRIFRSYIEKKYGKAEAKKRIYVTTDEKKGALKTLADKEGYAAFTIPNDIGGRYSVLTAVGLLPIAVSGINIKELIQGAKDASQHYHKTSHLNENEVYQYAVIRNLFYQKGKVIEVLTSSEPSLTYFSEWWKQLFGESEGKDGKGIFPAALSLTTDLHSLGQYLQEGRRILFETVIHIKKSKEEVVVEEDKQNLDGLNYLTGQTLEAVNQKALVGTMLAHTDGGVPVLLITMPELNAYHLGYLIYFFEKACAISAYLLGVNAFDQPGVEAYKKNMFALLGKPGYEAERKVLEERIKKLSKNLEFRM